MNAATELLHNIVAWGKQDANAPWLRLTWSADKVRQFFEEEYRVTLEASGTEVVRYPEYPEPEGLRVGYWNQGAY